LFEDVSINKCLLFKGDESIKIEANGEARYELTFKPKTVGNWNGR
jgi:hypothetical protein